MKIRATITYTVDKKHPDYKCIVNPTEIQSFTDVYTFDDRYHIPLENCKRYCKDDLALVAGGGYDAKHIHNVKYTFEIL